MEENNVTDGGLSLISTMYFNMALSIERSPNYNILLINEQVETYYVLSAELNNSAAMGNLAMYYEHTGQPEKAIPYYLNAIEYGEVYAIFNLADYYEKIKDYEKMIFYYLIAVNDYNDILSLYELIKHSKFIGDYDLLSRYYMMALEHEYYDRRKVKKVINNFDITLILDKQERKSELAIEKLTMLCKIPEIIIYKNKIRLFTNLKNIVECFICFEEHLNIDLHCGHCVCIYCYQRLFNKKCPLCRL